ncbi:MAG: NAD(P)H-binding protein [Methanobrevibacter sp.]|nr:NAD(P)H-binding protein [Methanobrevibacter sp.]MBR0371835.1 NAD(P)H-binding protein [Methanobrevibacter sp.]
MTKNILILGATGKLGSALTKEIVKTKDWNVTQFSRTGTEKIVESDNITVLTGDAATADIFEDYDIVYCAISGSELPEVASNLVKYDIKRLLFTGAVGIYNEIIDEVDGKDNVDNNPHQVPNRDAVEIIENSDINYTILRPEYLRDGELDDYQIILKGKEVDWYKTSLPAFVNFIIKIIDEDLYSKESVAFIKHPEE